jgi:hypothetical protein
MRKFVSILFALVLCVSAMVVIASAATNCPEHDWTAWKTVRIENGDKVQERYCACGAIDTKIDHTHKLTKTAAVAPTCTTEGNVDYWYCAGCDNYFADAEGKYNVARLSCMLPATHDLQHVEAKDATCLELGNIEYWACKNCDRIEVAGGVLSNIKAVQLPTLDHTIEHVAAKAPGCEIEGNVEYWYCTVCGYAWLDEARTQVTNLLSVKIAEAHNVEHVAAVAPTATENGNIEYWYCKDCGYAWLDELCTKNTNLKAVILPATGEPTAPSNPDTGDNAIYFAVALVAVATLGVAAVSFKKREN